MTEQLHIYLVGTDWVIAKNAADAREIVRSLIGDEVDQPDFQPVKHPDDQPFSVTARDEPGQPTETMMPGLWVGKYGRGPIASNEI